MVGVGDGGWGVGKRIALCNRDFLDLGLVLVGVGLGRRSCLAEADLHRVMVGGAEWVAVAVQWVVAVAEEVLDVVEAAGVLERVRLIAVNVPHRRVLDQLLSCLVSKDVVKGTQLAAELVGRLVEVALGLHDAEAALFEDTDGVFLGVCVEVANQERRKRSPLGLLVELAKQRLGLLCAQACVVALAITGVFVALGNGALGFEVVDHGHEVVVLIVADGVELLGEWLAGGAGERGVVENDRLPNRLHLRRLVDERDADHVLIGAELLRGLHQIPLVRLLLIQRVHKVLQRLVALRLIAGHAVGVFDLREAKHVSVQLVNRRDNLRLLILECLLGKGAADLATVRRDRGAVNIVVRLAALLVFTQAAEVVQHVEEADGVVTLNSVRHVVGGLAGILPRDRQLLCRILAGDRLQRLESPLVKGVIHNNVSLELHLVARADGFDAVVRRQDVRQGGVLVGAEVVAGAAVVKRDKLQILLLLQGGCGCTRRNHIRRGAVGALTRRKAQVTGGIEGVVVGHRVGAGRADQHALVRLAGIVAGRQGVDLGCLRRLKRLAKLLNRGERELGLLVVLADLAGHAYRRPTLRKTLPTTHIDENAVRRIARVLRCTAATCGLEEETVLAALVIHSRDDALRSHRLPLQRGSGAGTLDLCDRSDRAGLRLRSTRVLRVFGLRGCFIARVLRGRLSHDEVRRVVVCVHAYLRALDGLGVARACGRGALWLARTAPTDSVNFAARAG